MNVSDAVIRERDGNRCAKCGGTRDLHVHHRMLRSAGSDERACNRVTLCQWCHRWVHVNPALALEQGWIVSRYGDPAEVKIEHHMWPAYPIWLEPEGGIRLI